MFLPVVLGLYWALRTAGAKAQNYLLILAGYAFYGSIDWRFAAVLFISTLIDFETGKLILYADRRHRRKSLLFAGVMANALLLFYFKHAGFFIAQAGRLFGPVGFPELLMPIGLSFYTLKKISYLVDVYRKRVRAVSEESAYFAYISFFPALLAGPVDRAPSILHRFLSKRRFSGRQFQYGLAQILNGLLKKTLADALAPHTESLLLSGEPWGGPSMVMGVFLWTIRLYCDFSGWSDIAIGTGRLFGFRLTRNFSNPFFSRCLGEFHLRWHTSVSLWFRDHVYFPLRGRKPGGLRRGLCLVLGFALYGLWHGAGWNYAIWGALTGMLLLLPVRRGTGSPKGEFVSMAVTFITVMLLFVFFLGDDPGTALGVFRGMLTSPISGAWYATGIPMAVLSLALLCLEWLRRDREFLLHPGGMPGWLRLPVYIASALLVFLFGSFQTGFLITGI